MKDKYILTEWPESQDFVGNPECYLVHSLDHNERQLDSAYFVPADLFIEWKTMNKNVTELEAMHEQYKFLENMLRESIRKYLSRLLMHTSEENPLDCKICLVNDEAIGLSTLNFPWVYKIWQHPTEGIIYFHYDTTDTEPVEFDAMLLEDLITICKELDK